MVIYDTFYNNPEIGVDYKIYGGSMNLKQNNIMENMLDYPYDHITLLNIKNIDKHPLYKGTFTPVPTLYIKDYYLLYELFKKIGVDQSHNNYLEISTLDVKNNVVNIPEAFYKLMFDMVGIKNYYGHYEVTDTYDKINNRAKVVLGDKIEINIIDDIRQHPTGKYDVILVKYMGIKKTTNVLIDIHKILNKNGILIIEYDDLNMTPIYKHIATFEKISIFRGRLIPDYSPFRYIICSQYNNGVPSADFLDFVDDINNEILDDIVRSSQNIKLFAKKLTLLANDEKRILLKKINAKHINKSIEWCHDNNIEINPIFSHEMKRRDNYIIESFDKKEYFPEVNGVDLNKLKIVYESLYSITRAKEAQIISDIIKDAIKSNDIIVTDGTANAGGNTINFAQNFKKVHAIEIEPNTCDVLKNNIDAYNFKNVVVHCGDFLSLYPTLKQDVIFFDPPWGGKGYKYKYSLDIYLSGKNISDIVADIAKYAKMILIKVPHNFNLVGFYRNCGFNKMDIQRINKFSLIVLSANDLIK